MNTSIITLYDYKIYSEAEAYERYLEAQKAGKDFDMYTLNISCYIEAAKQPLTKNQFLLKIERPPFNRYIEAASYEEYIILQRKHLHAILPNKLIATAFMKYSEDEFRQALSGSHPSPKLNRYRQMKFEEFVWNSNKIENIEIGLNDTITILAGGAVSSISYSDRLSVLNAKRAFELRQTYKNFPTKAIELCRIHQELMNGLRPDAGILRSVNVSIASASHTFPDHSKVSEEILKLRFLECEDRILHAAKLHAALVNIHPFSDGNGRISRLVTHPYTNIPHELRMEYYSALDAYGSYGDFGPMYYLVHSLNSKTLNIF